MDYRHTRMGWGILLTGVFLLAGCLGQGYASADEAAYEQFVDDFLEWYFQENPIRSTRLGIHDYDHQMPDVSADGQEQTAAALQSWLERLQEIDREALPQDEYFDYQILDHAIQAQLLELEEVQSWRHDPRYYNSVISGALAALVDRDFAPVEERMRSIMARYEQIPDVTAAARTNLEDVPPLWVELAINSTRGTASFIENDLPRALEAQGLEEVDPALREEFEAMSAEAVSEVRAYADWLEEELQPEADGDFRLGRELFEAKLRYEEHVDLSADELREMNEEAIRNYKEWVEQEAARVDAEQSPAEVMEAITSNYPAPEELIPTARTYQDDLQTFIHEQELVTLPSDDQPVVRETPSYARMGFASMNTPGPFETEATTAYYNITNVDPEWSEAEQHQHLTYFNYPGLLGITIHESFPGHFVQLLYRPQIPSRVRKIFQPSSLVEGWAHYTEQMMLDEGFGRGNSELRLGQLRRALQRHARWYAGLDMHAFGASIEEATERYQEIAYFEEFPALREVQRGTYDPTYLYYALGRMQILELREDYKAYLEERGEPYSLKRFHDEFLSLGLPISLAREAMMPDAELAE